MTQTMNRSGLRSWTVAAFIAAIWPASAFALEDPISLDLEFLTEAAKTLELKPETLRIIKERTYEAQKSVIVTKAELESTRLDLKYHLEGPAPDRAAIMRVVERIGQLETKLRKQRLGLMLDVRALLTPSQRERLKEFAPRVRKMRKRIRRERKRKKRKKIKQPKFDKNPFE